MRYILKSYYRAASGERVLAEFVVHDPVISGAGILCSHETAWGGTVRCLHKWAYVVDFFKEG